MNDNKKNKIDNLPFGRVNIIMLITSINILFVGYTTMSIDSHIFGFGFLGLTLGPIITVLGFIFVLIAILKKPI